MFMIIRTTRLKPRDYAEIRKEGILRIVTEYNPSGYYVSGDTIAGFQYELCLAIASLSGIEIEISLEMSLAESFKGLLKQKYDIIARNIPLNTDIKETYLFTDPVVFNKQSLIQHISDSIKPLRNQLELAGKTIHVTENSPSILRLQNLMHEIGDTIYIVEEKRYSTEQLIIMVLAGDIDYTVCDRQTAETAKQQYPEIDIETDISFTQLQSWALRKDSPILADSLNHWFETIRSNGMFDEIFKRYYKSNVK